MLFYMWPFLKKNEQDFYSPIVKKEFMKSDLRLTNVDSTCSFDNIALFWSTFRFAQGTIVLVLQNLG